MNLKLYECEEEVKGNNVDIIIEEADMDEEDMDEGSVEINMVQLERKSTDAL